MRAGPYGLQFVNGSEARFAGKVTRCWFADADRLPVLRYILRRGAGKPAPRGASRALPALPYGLAR